MSVFVCQLWFVAIEIDLQNEHIVYIALYFFSHFMQIQWSWFETVQSGLPLHYGNGRKIIVFFKSNAAFVVADINDRIQTNDVIPINLMMLVHWMEPSESSSHDLDEI